MDLLDDLDKYVDKTPFFLAFNSYFHCIIVLFLAAVSNINIPGHLPIRDSCNLPFC